MGSTLFNTTPQNTYPSLIKIGDNLPLSGTLKVLSDGNGNDSVLALSTISLQIGGATGATWDNTNKRLGIGTTTPGFKLDVNGTAAIRAGNQLRLYRTDNATYGSIEYNSPGTGFKFDDVNGDGYSFAQGVNTQMRITGAGNVGIGTSTPTNRLHVLSSGFDVAKFDSTFGQMAISFANNGTTFAQLGSGVSVTGTGGINDLGLGTAGAASTNIIFATGSGYTERMRVTSNGYLRLSVATGGIQFNGDTAAANALDDYEEGTWTPVLRGASIAGTYETSLLFANYTKIGRQVSVNMIMTLAAAVTGGGTGYAQITGLPFSKSTNQQLAGTVKFNLVNFGASTAYCTTEFISTNATSIFYFVKVIDNANPIDVPISAFGNNSVIQVSLTYFV